MDRGTARSLVALKAEDPQQTQFTTEQYNQAIELAEQQFAIDAKAIIREATITVVANQASYGTADGLPSDILMCVLVKHKGLKLRPTDKWSMSFQSATDWTVLTGTPKAYIFDDENQKLLLINIPQAEDAGANLSLLYIALPAAIANDNTVLLSARSMLQAYTPAIVNWAAREVLSYKPMTQETIIKQNAFLKEYMLYRDQCIEVYNNMVDQPIQMKGGRNWQDINALRGKSNAFDD